MLAGGSFIARKLGSETKAVKPLLSRMRSRTILSCTLALGALLSSIPAPVGAADPYEDLRSAIRQMHRAKVVSAPVSDFPFQRECATFVLQQGRLYLFPEIYDGRHVALFEGEGRFLFTPPIRPEREQLERVFDQQRIDTPFDRLFLFFADQTAAQL